MKATDEKCVYEKNDISVWRH